MLRRARPGETPCTGVWPKTGNACRNAPRDGHDTCDAHAPEGDLRAPAPPEHQRCTGTNKESGERCRRHHATGGKVCAMHGGNARQVRGKADERVVEETLMSLAADLVGTPIDNPLIELGKVAGRARAWMELLEERVHSLLEDGPDPGQTEKERAEHGIRYRGGAGEQTRAEVALYERAMAQLGTMLTAIARLDIDTRLAAITERQADAVVAALEAGLTAAGIRDPGQRTIAKAAAARELRLVK